MKFLMLFVALSFALPASADLFFLNPGEGGKCALSPRAQKKHAKSTLSPEDRVMQGINYFTQYDSKNFAIFLGSLECDYRAGDIESCWEKEEEILNVDGNNDCSVKYTDIYFDVVGLAQENDPNDELEPNWVHQGSVASPANAKKAWDAFKVSAQHDCDSVNWVKKGQSKVEFFDNSAKRTKFLSNKIKDVTIDYSARCYLQD